MEAKGFSTVLPCTDSIVKEARQALDCEGFTKRGRFTHHGKRFRPISFFIPGAKQLQGSTV
jgi:hypothetical protein